MAPTVYISMVIDFMCPWSFIALRSLRRARERVRASGLNFEPIAFTPFEFDPPGTYPPEGQPWTDYCSGYGEAKARFLLEEKLPRAFELGERVGIKFSMEKRVFHTVDVNAALVLAQQHGVAEDFAEAVLSAHFEQLQDPNDPALLRRFLGALGVPVSDLDAALADPQKQASNARRTADARKRLRSGVPHFEVRNREDGEDLCLSSSGGPTSPEYFEAIFARLVSTGPGKCGDAAQCTEE